MEHALAPSPATPQDLADPFDGFFSSPEGRAPDRSALLDIPQAKGWLDVIDWGCRNDLYTYQQPLAGKSGPCVTLKGRQFVMLSSYDYLGLIGHPAIEAAAIEAVRRFGTGTGGVRLLTGTTELHHAFEGELARWKGTEAALTFSSGYLANIGVISALLGPEDRVVADALVHRSVIDACRLAGVHVKRFAHNDPASLHRALDEKPFGGRTLIVSDAANTQQASGDANYITHTAAGVADSIANWAANGNSYDYNFQWQAPAGSDSVVFWAAGNAINNDVDTTGDIIYLGTVQSNGPGAMPAVSTWGIATMCLLTLAAGTLLFRRQLAV